MLSPYKITWLVFVPESGTVVTLKDQVKIFKGNHALRQGVEMLFSHYPSSAHAEDALASIKGKLSKRYRVYQINDKQFGKLGSLYDVLTTKQKERAVVV